MGVVRLALLSLTLMTSFTWAVSYRDIEYTRAGTQSLRLDAGIPDGPGPHPAAVIVHGGAWVRGDRVHNVAPLFEPLNRAGIAWFSISYRFATGPLDFGEAVADVQTAVQYVKSQAAVYNIDHQRVSLVGESAGGHLASMAALTAGEAQSVRAVVAIYTPSDLMTLIRSSTLFPPAMQQAARNPGFAGPLMQRLQYYSPIAHVRAGMPPFLLIHGTADRVVPYDQSIRMRDRIRAAGGEVDLLTVPGGGHGLRALGPGYASRLTAWLQKQLAPARVSAKIGD